MMMKPVRVVPSFRMKVMLSLMIMTMLLLSSANGVSAQSPGEISVVEPDTSAYPQITTSFRVIDPEGNFIKNLKPGELRVIENNATITTYDLEMSRTGMRFYVTFNEGPTLANRFSGVSRFDRIKTALYNWINSQSSDTTDDLVVITNQGPLDLVKNDPVSWQSALEAYQPDLRSMTPGMSSLSTAVDNALSSNLQSEKSSAILFITPLPTDVQFTGLADIITRAENNGIRVFIWLIGPPDYAGTDEALLLQQYAEQTGGRYFLFSGSEELPVLTDWLDPLAYIYNLAYTSMANVSGDYSLELHIQRGEVSLDSEPVSYSLRILPPNPIFLSPPAEVTRSWTETKKKSDAILIPDNMDLEFMVEFPDGMQRDLTASRLFVDGNLAEERTAAPFTTFTWDISGYTSSGSHTIQVLIEDAVGLKGQTIEIPVEVTVEELTFTFWERILEKINLVNTIVGIIVLAVIVAGLLVMVRAARRKFSGRKAGKKNDPVTQTVTIEGSYTLAPEKPEEIVKWPVIRGLGLAPARLLQKRSSSPPETEYLVEIPLGNDEIVIGSDRKKADYVLVHSSVSQRHSRIFKDADGNYRIADAGSSSGTWVNYAPVSTRGVSLEHGDLVQFGRLAYVFEVHGAAPKRVQVLPYKED